VKNFLKFLNKLVDLKIAVVLLNHSVSYMASTSGFEPLAYRLEVLKAMFYLVPSRYIVIYDDVLFEGGTKGSNLSSVSSCIIRKQIIYWQNVCEILPII